MRDDASRTTSAESRLRSALATILAFGIVGVAAELALLGHHEDWRQWIPLAVLALGLLSTAGASWRGSAAALRLHRVTMAGFLAAGFLGLWFHYQGNVEFEVEMVPSIAGWDLFKEAMTGATPALAPGTMLLLGLIGLAIGYRHPALRHRTGSEDEER